MSTSARDQVLTLIDQRQYEELAELVQAKRSTMRYLYRLLYHTDEITRCRTIEAMGIVAARMAQDQPESVLVVMRTLLWTINDESGGIGWSAPEAMAEIIYRLPDLCGDFVSIVLSNTDEPVLLKGVVRAAYRLAQCCPALVQRFIPEYTEFLNHGDPEVRGYTLAFIRRAGGNLAADLYHHLLQDTRPVIFYADGQLINTTVAELAKQLLS